MRNKIRKRETKSGKEKQNQENKTQRTENIRKDAFLIAPNIK